MEDMKKVVRIGLGLLNQSGVMSLYDWREMSCGVVGVGGGTEIPGRPGKAWQARAEPVSVSAWFRETSCPTETVRSITASSQLC